ncbi:GntR family transcriptional regulator [bacterium 210820-DFI.6.37]|nr:GntR family transcriptional regulator [bacterium 210820-DFI.6.37]
MEQRIDRAGKKRVLTLDVLLSKELEFMLETEGYQEGARLPSERELARRFGVQRGTIRSALQVLLDKGILVSRERSGYYVAPSRVNFDLNAYDSRKKVIEQMGKTTYVKLLTFEKIYVSEKMARKTGLLEDSQVYRIMRLRFASGQPMALEKTHIRCALAPGLSEEDVHNKSIYAALRKKHHIYIARSEEKVTAVYANGLESELLKTTRSKPLMRYEGLVYDRKNRLVEYFDDIILKEKVQFISNDAAIKKHMNR